MKKTRNQRNLYKKQQYGEYVKKINEAVERKRLIKLKKDLKSLGKFPEGDARQIILYSIGFLDAVSKFQDDGYLKYQPKEKKEIMERFNLAILKSGRQDSPKKWNFTKKGETVTKYNVTFGGIYGLPIQPASYWLSLPKNRKITLDFHSRVALDPANSPIMYSKTLWITEALVTSGIEQFTKKNSQAILNCLEKLLN